MKTAINTEASEAPKHGGRLMQASQMNSIPLIQWLDLSTGINPDAWPIPSIPTAEWNRLPETEDKLVSAACEHYHCGSILPVAGSQAAISALPRLRKTCRVGVLKPGYAEHAYCWQRAGHTVVPLPCNKVENAVDTLDVLVLINPNNPTGETFLPDSLLQWREKLAHKGGWLIVDEAFIDSTPDLSIAQHTNLTGLIVLRSLGKFFGLAGARVGFVLAHPDILNPLNNYLGPWTITGPSRYIATRALQDRNWCINTRKLLQKNSDRLGNLLSEYKLTPTGSTSLFQWVMTHNAELVHNLLCKHAVLVRLFREPASVRFGLPGNERQWRQLEVALDGLKL